MSVPISASVQVMMVSSAGSVRQAGRQAVSGSSGRRRLRRLHSPPPQPTCPHSMLQLHSARQFD